MGSVDVEFRLSQVGDTKQQQSINFADIWDDAEKELRGWRSNRTKKDYFCAMI